MSFGKALSCDVGPKGFCILIIHLRILLTSVSISVKQIYCQAFFHVSLGSWAGRRRHVASPHRVLPLLPAYTSDL